MNETNTYKNTNKAQKIIIPMSPTYIQDKVKVSVLELTWHQVIAVFGCVVLTIFTTGLFPGNIGIGFTIVSALIIWGAFYKYALTQEKYLKTKLRVLYHVRKRAGYTSFYAGSTPTKRLLPSLNPASFIFRALSLNPLYEYEIKRIANSIIHFSGQRYGVIIDCQTRPIDHEDLNTQIQKITGLLKSIQDKTVVKFRVSSYIPHTNPVEALVTNKITHTKNNDDKALLYSLYDMSSNAQKAPQWVVKIFVAIPSNDKQVDTYLNTILPGFLDRLHSSTAIATVLKDPRTIYQTYSHEMTGHAGINNKAPALYGDKSVWMDKIRQVMQGSTQEFPDHLVINHCEYVSCLRVGVPVGGVAGFPPTISPEILEQLYRVSASNDHVISMDTAIYPIASSVALTQLKRAINKLQKNEVSLEENKTTVYDLGLDIEDLQQLYSQIKDGRENLFDTNITITVYSPSYEKLQAGLSKVGAILSANNISNQIPTSEILRTIKATQFMPYYDNAKAVWMPASALSRILPITTGANNVISTEGLYFGNEVVTGQEILINLDRLGAQHTLLIGSSQSGKTTDLGLTGLRTVLNGDDFIYITNKPDWNTSYLRPAEYFKDRSQIINIGRQPDGTCHYNINPLEIMYNDGVAFDPLTRFYEHIDFVKLFLNLLTGGDRTDVQRGYIHETVLSLYAKFGFDPTDKKTWKPEKQPTLSNLYDIWESDYQREPKNTTIQAILVRATGFKNTLGWLSNPTNVNLTAPYTVIDLSAVPEGAKEAANYLLIHVLKLRFNPKNQHKTTIAFDECGVFLKQKELQDQLSIMLKQAASYRVRIVLGSQMLEDLNSIGAELRSNIYVSKVFGLNIAKNIDSAVSFFKFSPDDKKFLIECSKAGMAAVQVGYPYATTYHLNTVLSELETQILFGKQERLTGHSFINPDLESFSNEQGVIFGDHVIGDLAELKKDRTAIWEQRPIGAGKIYGYVKNELIENGLIGNQTPQHFLSVCYLASWLIERGVACQVNHYDDADIIATFRGGNTLAIEWQTPGHNDVKNLMKKRQTCETKHGQLVFTGSPDACREMRNALNDDEIVVSRGKQLENLLTELMTENTT